MMSEKKAQGTLEYVLLVTLVVSALVAMNIYFKRSISGKMRESTDQIGEQFEPTRTYTHEKTTYNEDATTTRKIGGAEGAGVTNTSTARAKVSEESYEDILKYNASEKITSMMPEGVTEE